VIDAIGRFVVLVDDFDRALAFYRDVLGFEVLYDAEPDGRGRFLHVGPPRQPGVGLWLMQPASSDRDLVGRQAGAQPLLVLYATDCRGAVEGIRQRGGVVLEEPREDGGAVVARIADPFDNQLVIAQLPAGA
jgi:predicted enzyme related to lactoylglutathione lyase